MYAIPNKENKYIVKVLGPLTKAGIKFVSEAFFRFAWLLVF